MTNYELPQMKYAEQKGLVSVIVPIYNNEIYLRECLDSVLSQTFTNWEAVLVDDGSTDNTGKIVDEYAEKDSRFIAIHKQNEGTLLARKTGLENSKGEFIANLDHDDVYNPLFLEKMHAKITETNADFAWCRCDDCKWNADASENIAMILTRSQGIDRYYMWDKLIKREIYAKVLFPNENIISYEDPIQMIQIAYHSKSFSFILENLYFHRGGGQGSVVSLDLYVKVIVVIKEILENLFSGIIPKNVRDIFYCKMMTDKNVVYRYFLLDENQRQKFRSKLQPFLFKFIKWESKLYFKICLFLAGCGIEFPFVLLMALKENKLKKFCKRYEIYVYGIGVYSVRAVNLFEKEKIDIEGFIVSDGFRSVDKFRDKPVYEISQMKLNDKQAVVVALNDELKKLVVPRLKKLGIRYIEF
jgi:glycosyltransferase involved in cell wall biosynthesis